MGTVWGNSGPSSLEVNPGGGGGGLGRGSRPERGNELRKFVALVWAKIGATGAFRPNSERPFRARVSLRTSPPYPTTPWIDLQ